MQYKQYKPSTFEEPKRSFTLKHCKEKGCAQKGRQRLRVPILTDDANEFDFSLSHYIRKAIAILEREEYSML